MVLNVINSDGKPVKMPEEDFLGDYCKKLRGERTLNNRVLFVKVPQVHMHNFRPEVAKNRGYQAYPPEGLKYLTHSVESAGQELEVDILDMNYDLLSRVINSDFDKKDWLGILKERIDEFDPSIVGVSSMFEPFERNVIDTLDYLRKEGSRVLLTGGTNATYRAKKWMEDGLCDFLCQREADNKIVYLFDKLFDFGGNAPRTPGILFPYNGKIQSTGEGNDVVDVVANGSIIEQHRKFPSTNYNEVGTLGPMSRVAGAERKYATPLITRGCRFACTFCGVRDFNSRGVRNRSSEDVVEELRTLYHEQGIRLFELLDDDFGGGESDYMIKVLEGIRDSDMEDAVLSAQNGMIARYISTELLTAMKDAGFVGFKVGIETGSEKMLHHVQKPATLESCIKFSQRMKDFPEIIVPHNYIIGFEDETFRMMMESYHFSGHVATDWCAFSIYQPIADKKEEGDTAKSNFQPVKSAGGMELVSSEGLLTGPEVFNLPLDEIPSREQMNHIWNAFNIARNFIYNPNMKKEGQPEKFIRYVGALAENYPTNSYMPIFMGIAHLLEGNNAEAREYHQKAVRNFEVGTDRQICEKFELEKIIFNFPESAIGARKSLNEIQEKHNQIETWPDWYREILEEYYKRKELGELIVKA